MRAAIGFGCSALRTSIAASARKSLSSVREKGTTEVLQAQLHFQKQFMGMSQSCARTARRMIADHLAQTA
jgi:hypothetical protein